MHDVPCLACSFLEHAVEGLRVDVVERRCKVVESEVNAMTTLLNTVMQSLKDVKSKCLGPREGAVHHHLYTILFIHQQKCCLLSVLSVCLVY